MIVDKVLQAHRREVLTVPPDDTLVDVARLFGEKRSGVALVCDPGGRLIGVVSLGDIVHAVGQRGADALQLPVHTIMTSDVTTCEPNEDISSALDKMTQRGIRHLPVVENGKLKGFIEKPAALEVLYDEASLDFSQLRNYTFKTGGRY
jgi:CBS domain-containing protein